ncbi:MAG: hypothetical protein ABJB04_03755 [Betaproteobacteria bacterium]
MNAKTQSNHASIEARNPQFKTAKTPRLIAAVAAVIITFVLFDGVALLGDNDDSSALVAAQQTMVAQASTSTLASR